VHAGDVVVEHQLQAVGEQVGRRQDRHTRHRLERVDDDVRRLAEHEHVAIRRRHGDDFARLEADRHLGDRRPGTVLREIEILVRHGSNVPVCAQEA
jgi:hypothetical protein